ncbi:MAG: hypothetical protein V4664_01085 [Patescibacteria group bacterium]
MKKSAIALFAMITFPFFAVHAEEKPISWTIAQATQPPTAQKKTFFVGDILMQQSQEDGQVSSYTEVRIAGVITKDGVSQVLLSRSTLAHVTISTTEFVKYATAITFPLLGAGDSFTISDSLDNKGGFRKAIKITVIEVLEHGAILNIDPITPAAPVEVQK